MDRRDRSWARKSIDEAGLPPEVCDALASGMPGSELWSLLLEVMEHRASRRTAFNLCEQWKRDRFVKPCAIDQRTLVELDRHLLDAASAQGFETIELSPVAPLGVCSAIALASQNKIVSTTRGTEVVSDPSNVMALECAKRLRKPSAQAQIVRLATSHRCTRAQPIPDKPGFAAHFRMFCLVSAGREQPNREFLAAELALHINTQLAALGRLEQHGYSFGSPKVRLLATAENAQLAQRIAAMVQSAPVEHHALDHPYYDGLRFMIFVQPPTPALASPAEAIPLIDGGAFDWLRKLLANRKMTLIASGMGAQVAAQLFRK